MFVGFWLSSSIDILKDKSSSFDRGTMPENINERSVKEKRESGAKICKFFCERCRFFRTVLEVLQELLETRAG